MIEKAKIRQATRLLEKDFDLVTSEDIATLCAEDIEVPARLKNINTTNRIYCLNSSVYLHKPHESNKFSLKQKDTLAQSQRTRPWADTVRCHLC